MNRPPMVRARDNPFSTDRVLRARYRLPDGMTWDDLLRRLERLDYRAALVGPEGAGKTTLLEDLEPRLREREFQTTLIRLSETRDRIPRDVAARLVRDSDDRTIVLLDGGDHLGRIAWRRFLKQTKKARGLVVTSHQPGLLPTLVDCSTTPELLNSIIREILGANEPPLNIDVQGLFDRHNGNIRDALRELYDLAAAPSE